MASAPLFGNPAISEKLLTRGFASQPHDWFAVIGEGSKSNLLESGDSKVSARALDRVQDDCLSVSGKRLERHNQTFRCVFPKRGWLVVWSEQICSRRIKISEKSE